MNDQEIAELLDGNVDDTNAAIDVLLSIEKLGPDGLVRITLAEEQGKNRVGVLNHIEDCMAELADKANGQGDDPDAGDETPEESGKAERGEIPDWQKEDYTSPMTCEIAEWRNTNLYNKDTGENVNTK